MTEYKSWLKWRNTKKREEMREIRQVQRKMRCEKKNVERIKRHCHTVCAYNKELFFFSASGFRQVGIIIRKAKTSSDDATRRDPTER